MDMLQIFGIIVFVVGLIMAIYHIANAIDSRRINKQIEIRNREIREHAENLRKSLESRKFSYPHASHIAASRRIGRKGSRSRNYSSNNSALDIANSSSISSSSYGGSSSSCSSSSSSSSSCSSDGGGGF